MRSASCVSFVFCAGLGVACAADRVVVSPAPVDVSGAVAVDVPGCPPVAQLRRGAAVFPSGWRPTLVCSDDAVTLALGAGQSAVVDDRGEDVVVVVDDACAGICGGASITDVHRAACKEAQPPSAPLRLRRPARLVVVTPPECDPRLP